MKSQVRVLGFDDAPFRFGSQSVLIIGTVMRLPGYLEGILRTECRVDGDDATDALVNAVLGSRFREQVKLVMIDGVALGGFNVVDIDRFRDETGLPAATVTRDRPDMSKIESALRKHFPDWRDRLEIIERHELHEVGTGHKPLYVSISGMKIEEVRSMLRQSIVRGAMPEPLRVAHIIASGVVKGESRGRA
ncbi:MAG TPA: DUF99 family protein [Methanomassiliicoccales archaeon]|nr:DUF99 family protein [Methanomassiliicoccales archaeon]